MTVSLLCAQQVDSIDVLAAYAALCDPDGMDRLWIGQSLTLETFSALSALAGSGVHVRCGTAVSLAPLRTPYDAAVQARSAAALMGEPMSVAFGIGTPQFAAHLRGSPLERPAAYTADYVRSVRAFLQPEGEARDPNHEGALYPLEAPPIEVGTGVLRPRMARLAGAAGDFIVTWLSPLRHVVDHLAVEAAEGAMEAGRSQPPRTVSIVPMAVSDSGRHPYKLAYFACAAHMQAPHYAAALRAAGMNMTGDLGNDIPEAVRTGLFVYGSVDAICDVLEEHHAAGVDEVVLNLAGVAFMHGGEAALADARAIAEAWSRRRT